MQLPIVVLADTDLAAVGIMFSHYLFDVMARQDRFAAVRPRWQQWAVALEQGFTTFLEHWGPTRSDCHA